ncbi:uncharacterized protein HMPREF1541_09964 [Cyphellophora europaea CBS 101466]|uniref:PH domain-containing protein n=1 Tax=Cyphellophora europaea (strain CBS 101466) TaxID=1220924 RepID=W2SAN8_CYPE1|nr:uncharacterized protein HMPREF1541_09964 [Cyphellophora europaea CBS 101466]ETN45088.1 hypothetical protein HMPREF1541_09964 [Cyphellophora europaea CBS 101466]
MAQVAQPARPMTPPKRLLNAPILSPSSMPPPPVQAASSYSSYKGHMGLDVFSPVDQNGSFCFDRVIKSGKVARRIKKKRAWKASWKPAYLVLRPNLLSIYGNADETDLRESIALSDITTVARVKKSHHENVFGIFSPSKNYHFQSSSEQDTLDWVTQIRLEARTDDLDLDPLDPPAPHFSRSHQQDSQLGISYDTTDLSADDSPEPVPDSPSGRPGSKRDTTRPRGASNIAATDFSGTEHLNTSYSSFSDFHPGTSAPKVGSLSTSLPKQGALSPIASAQQLRPPLQARNTSQLSLGAAGALAAGETNPTDPERVIRQGFLSVQSTKTGIKTWKPLWTVLRPYSLSFYKNEQEYAVLKMLPVSSIIDAVEVDPLGRKHEWVFEVIAEEKTLKCSVRGEEDMVGWLGALKSVVERQKREGGRTERERNRDKERGMSAGVADGVKGMSLK